MGRLNDTFWVLLSALCIPMLLLATEAKGAYDTGNNPGAPAGPIVTVEPEISRAPAAARHAEQAPQALLGSGIESMELPPMQPEELPRDEESGEFKTMLQIGVVRELPENMASVRLLEQDWIASRAGHQAWSLRVRSPEAHAVRLCVAIKDMPDTAQLVCYDAHDPRVIFGAYTGKELRQAAEFWTPSIFSDTVVLEWQLPPDMAPAEGTFRVNRVAHTFVHPDDVVKQGFCHNDFTCASAVWRTRGTGIARISFVEGLGQYVCSGALINDSSPQTQVPYFMTAYHCISNSTVSATVEFYWLYQTSICNGAPPSLTSVPRTTGGAAYLQGRSATDFALLRVNNPIPGGLTLMGWTTAVPAIGSEAVCIHHPQGSYKRISYGSFITRTVDSANFNQVRYSSGSTEGGSSGSPIFNSNGYFVGQLLGGNAACDNMSGYDVFGRFDVTWPYVRQWLESSTSGPPNDNCANAAAISGLSGTATGTNVGATKEPGEPNHGNNVGGASVWWVWTVPSSGMATVETCGSSFDTTLGVYTGNCGALSSVAQNDDACGQQSRVTFNAAAGTAYLIAVDGYNGSTGSVALAWTHSETPPVLTVTPASYTAGTDAGTTTFTVRNDGGGTMNWSASEACDWLSLSPVSGSLSAGGSRNVTVTYTANTGSTRSCGVTISATGATGSPKTFTLNQPAAGSAPPNDNCANAISIPGTSGSVTGTNVGATKEPGEPNHGNNAGGASVWWVWTAPSNGTATVETCGSSFDTTLGVYSGDCGSLVSVAQNDDACGAQSRVNFKTAAGTTYRIAVDGFNGSTGNITLAWTHIAEIAVLAISPTSRTAGTGSGTTTFTVRNDGNETMSWAASETCGWVSLSPASGSLDAGQSREVAVTYQANTGGARACAVTVSAAGATGSPKTFTLNQPAVGSAPPNDDCANATPLSGASGAASGANPGATKEPGEPEHGGNAGGASVWWVWTAPSSGTATVEMCGSGFNTLLGVYTGNCGALSSVAQNDDGCGQQSRVTFNATAGTAYRIAVDGRDGSTGTIALTYQLDAPVSPFPDLFGCDCSGGKGPRTLENLGHWLGDFLLLGFSLLALIAMAYGHPPRRL